MEHSNNIVDKNEARRFLVDCMTKVGTCASHAEQLADVLIAGDYRGHYSHGLNRLEMYMKDIDQGVCAKEGQPVVLKEKAATAWVDGKNLLGPVVGNFCIDLAVKKAKEAGIGWVVAKGSNHFGIAGWYGLRALDQGCMGMSFTNTSPFMVPTRSKARTLGTNPLCLAAPAKNGDSFVLDMATTAVALGKIEIADRKGQSIPAGWGVDRNGKETTNPKDVLQGDGGCSPLGGTEQSCGYKGYGLAMLVEVFCGIMGGASFGPNVRTWMNTSTEANLGQCFIAIDPDAFAPGFAERMQSLLDACRSLEPSEADHPVLVPGDPERLHMDECDKLGGIPYHPNQLAHAKEIAAQYGVKPMQVLGTKGL